MNEDERKNFVWSFSYVLVTVLLSLFVLSIVVALFMPGNISDWQIQAPGFTLKGQGIPLAAAGLTFVLLLTLGSKAMDIIMELVKVTKSMVAFVNNAFGTLRRKF